MSSMFVVSTSTTSSLAPGVGNTIDNNESATFATSSTDPASTLHSHQQPPLEQTTNSSSKAPELSTLGVIPPAVTKSYNSVAFSDDLRRILSEVATKGSSSVLPWKHDNVMVWTRPASRSANHPEGNTGRQGNNMSNYTSGSSSRRHHDYHSRSSSHKRSRMSTMTSQQRHLHTSNRSSSTTATATMTTTMILESKNASSIRKSFPNGSVSQQQQPNTTTSSLFVIRPQLSSSPHATATSTTSTGTSTFTNTNAPSAYQNSLAAFLPNASAGRATGSIASYTAASGSEHEDTSQYECDSEGTSATSNSEMSFGSSISKRRGMSAIGNIGSQQQRANLSLTIAKRSDQLVRPKYLSVRDALMSALSFVLDYYYQNRGGYKLSPLEQRIYNVGSEKNEKNTTAADQDETHTPLVADVVRKSEEVFQKRKKRLLEMLGRYCNAAASDQESSDTEKGPNIVFQGMNSVKSLPPFTIQRLAEVLMEPERYYSQTHKLCNCIEKLLLVTSSVSAFGGSIGGGTTQSRQEETEIAALTEERKRLRSEFRQRHKKSRRSSNTPEIRVNEQSVEMGTAMDEQNTGINPTKPGETTKTGIPDADADDDDDELLTNVSKNDILDAAARATLRSKFDHVGIDPHSPAAMANSRDVMALMESRRLLNSTSPPPPPLSHNALQQQLHPRQSSPSRSSPSPSSSPESSKAMLSPRIPSPLLFHNYNPVYEAGSPTTLSPILSPSLSHPMSVPLPLRQHHPNLSLPTAAMMSTHNHPTGGGSVLHGESINHSVEALQKSSPASSDLDSESDIDDSASDDRSDGSDNERSLLLYEPLTAAQAMALNRRHQQARMQSRLLTAAATQHQQQQQQIASHANQNYSTAQCSGIMDGYHHRSQPTESTTATSSSSTTVALEYKSSSGDSLDSKRAEDSGGSDSSSSDHAD